MILPFEKLEETVYLEPDTSAPLDMVSDTTHRYSHLYLVAKINPVIENVKLVGELPELQ